MPGLGEAGGLSTFLTSLSTRVTSVLHLQRAAFCWLLITFYGMQEEGGCLAEIIPLNLQLGCLSPFHFSVHTGRPRRVARRSK